MEPGFAQGYALIIAVDESQMPGYALPTVARDAAALAEVLTHPDRCAYLAGHVRVISGREASRDGIREGLDWLRQMLEETGGDEATAIVYFTGHGARDPRDDSYYLLPYDFGFPVRDTAIPADWFSAELLAIRPKRLLVVLDCCHAAGMGIKGEDPLWSDDLRHSAAMPDSAAVCALALGRGRAVLSSSTGEEQSYVRKDLSMSIFTYHLIEALTGHAQPRNGGNTVLVSDLMGYVARTVPATARKDFGIPQTPYFQLTGENFPIALLIGGQGLGKGDRPPDPLEDVAMSEIGPGQIAKGGIYVGGDVNTAGGAFVGRDLTIHGSAVGGNKANLSGDFQGAIVTIDSTLREASQRVMGAETLDSAGRAELVQLLAAMQVELDNVPLDRSEAAESVAGRVQGLTTEVERGDREMMTLLSQSLKRSAEQLADVRPNLPTVATQLSELVRRLCSEQRLQHRRVTPV